VHVREVSGVVDVLVAEHGVGVADCGARGKVNPGGARALKFGSLSRIALAIEHTSGLPSEMKRTSVILPCAGKGTRLGLPYPKEVHRLSQSKSLVDFSLNHVLACPEIIGRAVTVLAPGKEMVFEYVARQLGDEVEASSAYFNEHYTEWPGSIRSAEAHFLERNVALLPDSVLVPVGGARLLAQFDKAFDDGADLVFAYVPEQDRARLQALGALRVNGHTVEEFCDKPRLDNPSAFNGFWASFGFTQNCSVDVLDFMMASVSRDPVDIAQLGLNVQAFEVKSYVDLGTWPNLSNFLGTKSVLT